MPVMSEGMRSGVNWMRLNWSDMASASERTRSVLARPGTPTQQGVAAAENGNQKALDHFILADDDARQLLAHPFRHGSQFVNRGHVIGRLGCGRGYGRSRLINHMVA